MSIEDIPKEEFKDFVVESFKYKTLLSNKFKQRKHYVPADMNKQYAVLPGIIKEVRIKEGDKVSLTDDIMVFEAMKMNNVVLATGEGKVKKIHVKVGDPIFKSQLLIEYEPA
ncbi:MAG TPA: biotin/lipoyl-containing protein [Bacteroidales bacterium]|nr:biotin/lipoyl-containing protein [Bacteroidales bacterium]